MSPMPLDPGPCGALIEVDNYDSWEQTSYPRVDLDDPKVLLQDGRTPSPLGSALSPADGLYRVLVPYAQRFSVP